jgi:serine/threonine protein kinase
MPCPTEDTLVAVAAGRFAGDANATYHHIESCSTCRVLFNEMARSYRHEGDQPHLGQRVGRYELRKLMGIGGMGMVYAAHDPELDRDVAIKLLRADIDNEASLLRARMLREAQAMARLKHPNVISVYDVGLHGSQVFVAMELIDGQTLREWLDADRRPWREVLRVLREAGQGLAAAHEVGIVHRDFKPDNIMIDRDGSARVLDFGLARSIANAPYTAAESSPSALMTSLTGSAGFVGTPAYMAPEQLACEKTDARTDQFSFCVVLYQSLTGVRPFTGATPQALLTAIREGRRDTARESQIPSWIRPIIIRGLRANPDERFASMAELLAELERDPVARQRRRSLALAALLTTVALSAAGIVLFRAHVRSAWRPELHGLPAYQENSNDLAFSPDGTRIAFDSTRDGSYRVYVAKPDGSDARPVTPQALSAHHPSWSHDGRALLFRSGFGGVWRVDLGSGTIEKVDARALRVLECGARSIIRREADGFGSAELVIRDAEGKERPLLEGLDNAATPHAMTCDRRGERIVYVSEQGDYRLWQLSLSAHELRLLTPQPFAAKRDPFVRFSADDSSVLYSRTVDQRTNLWELPLDGGSAMRFTFDEGADVDPAPSPDGRQLIFDIDSYALALFARDIESGQQRRVTMRLDLINRLAITPDGRTAITSSERDGQSLITAVPLDGSQSERVLGAGSQSTLSPDGRIVFYVVQSHGTTQLVATPVSGGFPRILAEVPFPVKYLASGGDGWLHLTLVTPKSAEAWRAPMTGGAAEREAPAPWMLVLPAPHGSWRLARRTRDELQLFAPGAPLDHPTAELSAGPFAWSQDGASFLFMAIDGTVWRYSIPTGRKQPLFRGTDIDEVALSPDNQTAYFTEWTGQSRRQVITNFDKRPRP